MAKKKAAAAKKTVKKTAAKKTKAAKGLASLPSPIKRIAGSKKTEQLLFTSLAVGAAGVLGYLGWKYYKKKKGASSATDLDKALKSVSSGSSSTTELPNFTDFSTDTTTTSSSKRKASGSSNSAASSASNVTDSDFPLKKGSKGDKVRQLQNALIAKYGKSALPKYGADGDFGTETANALKKNGLPISVDESTFNVLVQGNSDGGDSSDLAGKLYTTAITKNFNTALSLLKTISGKEQYQQVSTAFTQMRLRGVRQTLVNGMLGSFTDSDQKQQLRMQFLRMGLQYNGSKWSLSGFDGRMIVTKMAAAVWVSPTQSVPVPALMVLGNEVTQRLDYTVFENNNHYFLIKTEKVKYL